MAKPSPHRGRPGGPTPLGKHLRAMRQALGMSQTQLAGVLGVHQPMITAWERGRRWPSREQMLALAAIYNVPLELYWQDGEREAEEEPPAGEESGSLTYDAVGIDSLGAYLARAA